MQLLSSQSQQNNSETKTILKNDITVHIKWVKQTTKCIRIPLFGSAAWLLCCQGLQ